MLPVAFDSCLGLDLGPVAGLEVEQQLEADFSADLEVDFDWQL